ncbi:Pentatricopeptide repeat-containing protein [Rhynchospora pubera]|uniref:Pentatricopeptide repeat-containing protein n=1 Tax=Rhynchospora pubera TaxID=906938 RepID=A0AAV8G8C6_9POAL|nr:Pentatricopeptide repeat-containing protein [Rhynchospora pubera]
MQTVRTGRTLSCNCNCYSLPHNLQNSSTSMPIPIRPPLTSTSNSNLTLKLNSQRQQGRRNCKEQFQMPLERRNRLSEDLNPQQKESCPSHSALLLHYANNGLFSEAQTLCEKILNRSLFLTASGNGSGTIDLNLISSLVHCYAQLGRFNDILPFLDHITSRHCNNNQISHSIYTLAVSCFGATGQLELMEETLKRMKSKGLKIDSTTGNTYVKYYSHHGSILEMEYAYHRLKKSRILIEKDAIRAVASAYIQERKYFKLGEFTKDVGLSRLNVGNLLWNLLLLSYAVDFKMKTLQREFLNMLDNGFKPNLDTFNIRALAFSKMCMFWDLHLSLDHMKHEGVHPDLVTYGCFVEAYLERRLGRNLSFALEKMDTGRVPMVCTDPLVFEAFGKGAFHASSEVLLESARHRKRSYSELIRVYLKRHHRSHQVFWNY